MIWEHEPADSYRDRPNRSTCAFCVIEMVQLMREVDELKHEERAVVYACPRCGWWLTEHRWSSISMAEGTKQWNLDGASGRLRNLAITDYTAALDDIRALLLVKGQARFDLHPRSLEDLVASVYRDLGLSVEVTAFQKDGGIDVFLSDGSAAGLTGVQVKRTKAVIGVEQIRTLCGALVQADLTKGVFVTTSRFSSIAIDARKDFEARGLVIDLVDGDHFLKALELAQRPPFGSYQDFVDTYGDIELSIAYRDETGH